MSVDINSDINLPFKTITQYVMDRHKDKQRQTANRTDRQID